MRNSSCEVFALYFSSSIFEDDDYSTGIVNCVFNSFLCYAMIMLNIVTIHAMRKTLSLPKTLKTLLMSLASSDVGVGLLIQPFYISLLIRWSQQTDPACSTYKAFDMLMNLFSTASFCGVVAISVDRFSAIHFHFRYQELVTHKRIVVVVISIWVLSTFFSSLALWVPPNIHSLFVCIGTVIGLLATTLVYVRIYLAVRRHKNQIQVQQVRNAVPTGEITNFASLIKSAIGTFCVYLVFLVCYLPIFICFAAIAIYGLSIALNRLLLFSCTLLFLNSSLNPVIYCWKMRHIRHSIVDILRKMSRLRNRAVP